MTEILFARKTDVDTFGVAIAALQAIFANADFVTGTAQASLGAERVASTSTSIVTTLAAGQISWERAALTGDITAAQNGNITTLATVNANVGTFGSASQVGTFTVNGKGLITAASNVAINITASQVSDFNEAAQDAVGGILTDSAIIDFTYNDGANTITATVINNSIGNTQLRQGIARSVIGVTGNAGANVADIQGTTDQVLRVDTAGTGLSFGTVATGGITNAAVSYAKIQNVAASRLLGNPTGAPASPSEIDLNATLSFSGTSLQRAALTGDVTAAAGSNSVVVNQASSAFALTGDISPTALAADVNDYNPTNLATASVIRQAVSVAAVNITGLAGGADGRLIILHNISANTIILKDESASSTANNRFALTADITLSPDSVVMLQYDNTSVRWRNVGGSGGGGGGASTAEAFVTIGNTAGLSAERALTGGTGITLADAGANSTITINSTMASQADQETASSNTVHVTPGVQKFSPFSLKGWVKWGLTSTIDASAGVSSITDNGAADWTVNWSSAFSSANYAYSYDVETLAGTPDYDANFVRNGGQAAGSLRVQTTRNSDGALAEDGIVKNSVMAAGDI